MNRLLLTHAALVILCGAPVSAQTQTVNRTVSGQPDTDIRVGVYVNVKPDCTSGPLPAIQLTSPPEHGKVTVKPGKVTATNYKQCLAIEVPASIAFYRSGADFPGVDVSTLEVKFRAAARSCNGSPSRLGLDCLGGALEASPGQHLEL